MSQTGHDITAIAEGDTSTVCHSATESSNTRFSNKLFDQAENNHPIIQLLKRTPIWQYIYSASLISLDIAVMLLALVICVSLKLSAYNTLSQHMPPALFAVLQCGIWVICLLLCGTYHSHVMSEGYELYTKIINATILTIVTISSLVFMFGLDLPRTSVITTPAVAGILELIARWQMRRILHKWRLRGQCQYRAIIVGSPEGIDDMLGKLTASGASGYKPIAVCPIALDPECDDGSIIAVPYHGRPSAATKPEDQTVKLNKNEILSSLEDEHSSELPVVAYNTHLPRTAENLGAQIVIVADVISRDSEVMHTLPLAIESLGIELAVSVSVADIGAHRIDLDYSGDQPIIIATLPQYSFVTRFIKRVVDIFGALVGIVILGLLCMLPAAIAIKLEDGGPVIYRQKRIGRNEVPFDCYKLRSMKVNADKLDATVAEDTGQQLTTLFKAKEDPRVTKVGRFIRKYSIDEVPQFFNVLKGDMSLVGPRPQRQYEVDAYGPLYSTRLLVRPGITGPWQISGRSDLSQEEAEQLDVSYIQRWSITEDLAILAKTVMAVLTHKGSY